jgi:hypothetical protein
MSETEKSGSALFTHGADCSAARLRETESFLAGMPIYKAAPYSKESGFLRIHDICDLKIPQALSLDALLHSYLVHLAGPCVFKYP